MQIPTVLTLKNGLKICVIPNESVDSVTIHLRGLVGSNYEIGSEIGSAHLIEHLLIKNDQKNKIKSLGGKIVGVTSRDDVLYMVKVLKENLGDGIEFLSEILKPIIFSKNIINNQKEVVIQEIKRSLSMPEKAIGRLSRKILYPRQRMAKLNTGSVEDVQRLNIKDIQKFRDRLYFPNNFIIVVSGGINVNAALKYIQKYFNNFDSGQKAPNISHKQNKKLEIQCINNSSYEKTYVKLSYYSYPLNNDLNYTVQVLATILNTYVQNLVKETLGLSYKITCENFSSGSYGLFSIYFSSEQKNVEIILKEINRIIQNTDGLLGNRNIESVKKYIKTSRIFDFEKISLRADYYSTSLLHGRAEQNHEYEMERIKNIKASEVKEVTKKIFSQNPKITVLSKNLSEKDIKSWWNK